MASCTILSRGGAIVSGLEAPFPLGMLVLLPGLNLKLSLLSSFAVPSRDSCDIPSRVSGAAMPGVMFPGLQLLRFWYASSSSWGSQIILCNFLSTDLAGFSEHHLERSSILDVAASRVCGAKFALAVLYRLSCDKGNPTVRLSLFLALTRWYVWPRGIVAPAWAHAGTIRTPLP